MSTAAIDHPRGTLVPGPAAQVTVTAALAVLFVAFPTDQGRGVVDAVSGWFAGALAPGGPGPFLALLLGTGVVLGLVGAVVVAAVRERLWAVAYTLEEVVAVAVVLGIYGWVLANSTVAFLVVVAAQGAAATVRLRSA